ncbi:DHA2 family efflux MFS transporter permease subunit [Vulgatibacter incomptus]|uniref:Inner membrane component of tripartite multidrug resistance system n=1 Tax=Vulgatibacter incomptus TaxID=1391653 RepID=A0A0K1PCS3_9BACT|nr:DHA2 family efflux MFS transporter permease subunit [Vulgatibacter incomptus]AKU91338.1 Inner membrane component of tripartite multidrug resistance system [Vulgatibacter incomptus]
MAKAATLAASPAIPRAQNKWMIAAAVAIGALLELVDTSIVNVALREIQSSLGATLTQVSWVVSSYAVANVIILPMTAWLGERFGKKPYFVFSLIAFTLSSVLCGLSTNLPTLIVARVLQGLGGGGLLAKAQAILFETFPKEEQAMAQGFFSAIVIAGPVLGPTLGGFIVTHVGWRWIFFINVPVGILAALMCLIYLPKDEPSERARGGIDWLAISFLAIGLGSLQTMLEEGQSDEWFDSPFIVALAIGAVLGLALFAIRVLRSDRPIVDLRVLRHRSLWAGSILSIVVGMALYGALFALPLFAQMIMGYDSQQTGLLMLPGALASAAAMPFVARLNRKVDPRILLTVGSLVLVAAVMMLSRLSPQTGADSLFWPLIVRSIGTSMMFLPLTLAAIGPIPKHEISKATGLFALTRQLGGSIGVALLTTILAQRNAFHRTVLVEKLGAGDPGVLERLGTLTGGLVAKGFDPETARQKALALLDGMVNQQASVLSFGDTFTLTAALILCTVPLVILLGKPSRGTAVSVDH